MTKSPRNKPRNKTQLKTTSTILMVNNFRKIFLFCVYDLRFYTKWLNEISKWMQ